LEGCAEVQGFLFSRPVSAPEVVEMLNRINSKAVMPDVPMRKDTPVEAVA
jgi:hypothetical protein